MYEPTQLMYFPSTRTVNRPAELINIPSVYGDEMNEVGGAVVGGCTEIKIEKKKLNSNRHKWWMVLFQGKQSSALV